MTEKKIRFLSPFPMLAKPLTMGPYTFSTDIPLEEADALLCDWTPSPELLAFNGPKAWYCCEPVTRYPGYLAKDWQNVLQRLPPACVFNHLHPDPACRIPHITHWKPILHVNPATDRLPRGVAVVSNPGWERVFRHSDTRLRLGLATHPSVDLFGASARWSHFRHIPLVSRPRPPANFKGELPGAWGQAVKIRHLAGYKACVCLENTDEPYYFTEKFVDAVRAGCIPIYHAHPTVKTGILKGAQWVDPADFGYSVDRTMSFALAADRSSYTEPNAAWLKGDALRSTRKDQVYSSIADRLFQAPADLPATPPEVRDSLRRAFARLRIGARPGTSSER